MPSAIMNRVMVDCGVSMKKLERYWEDAIKYCDEQGWGVHDNRYWKTANYLVKQRAAEEGCKEMADSKSPAHQSRALRGLMSSLLSEYEAEKRGMNFGQQEQQ